MTIKAFSGYYLPVSTADALRQRAERVGASNSELLDLFIRFGLEKMSEEQLRVWVDKLPNTKGRHGGGLRVAERLILDTLRRLSLRGSMGWRFPGRQLAAESGMNYKDGYLALKSLRGRGLVRGTESDKSDRWGRPVECAWWLPEAEKRQQPAAPTEEVLQADDEPLVCADCDAPLTPSNYVGGRHQGCPRG